ncbi:MAG: hypothetical protein V3U65_13580 [Granulosicoccaceae bacterium]
MSLNLYNDTNRLLIKTQLRNQAAGSSGSSSEISRSASSDSIFSRGNLLRSDGGTAGELSGDVLSRMAVDAALRNSTSESTKIASSTDTSVASSGVNSPAEQKALDAATAQFQNRFAETAGDKEKFHQLMKNSFGQNYDKTKAENIRQQTLAGDFSWMPTIQLVDASNLTDVSGAQAAGEGLGAYSAESDTIFLNRELLLRDPAKAEEILTEEVGHALDTRINTSDAAGDEGNIFSILSHGGDLSAEELTELQAENDTGVIIVDGKKVEVEFGWLKKIGRSISRGIKRIGRSIKKAFNKIMQSKLFNILLTIASFIPIPIVQVIVRVVNVVKAAYNVYQGVKHGSIGMVLGGIAGVAGGVAQLGKMAGATGSWVGTANRIAAGARTASLAHQAISTKNWSAAASLAGNYFGDDHSVTKALDVAVKVDRVNTAIETGDAVAIANAGATFAQNFTDDKADAALDRVRASTATIQNIQRAADNGDTLDAIHMAATFGQGFTGARGDALLESVKTTADSINAAIDKVEESARGDQYGNTVDVFRTELGNLIDVPSGVDYGLQQLEQGVRYAQDTAEDLEARFENFSFNSSIPGATPGINPNAGN